MKHEDAEKLNGLFFWFATGRDADRIGVAFNQMHQPMFGIAVARSPQEAAAHLQTTKPVPQDPVTMVVSNLCFQFKSRSEPSAILSTETEEKLQDGPSLDEMVPVLETLESWEKIDFNAMLTPEGNA